MQNESEKNSFDRKRFPTVDHNEKLPTTDGGVQVLFSRENIRPTRNETPLKRSTEYGSTINIFQRPVTVPNSDYDPFANRGIKDPISYADAIANFCKFGLDSGIFALPFAFQRVGLVFGLIGLITTGIISAHCSNILVKSSHILLKRKRMPSLNYSGTTEAAFQLGPRVLRPYARVARYTSETFIVLGAIGCCSCNLLFIAINIKQIADLFWFVSDTRIHLLILLPIMIVINFMSDMKYLSVLSMVSNGLLTFGLVIIFYCIFQDFPPLNRHEVLILDWSNLPILYGTTSYLFAEMAIVFPLENSMKNPTSVSKFTGVINVGTVLLSIIYICLGSFGSLKYAAETQPSITLNLPFDKVLGQSAIIILTISILFSYNILFYPLTEVVRGYVKRKHDSLAAAMFGRSVFVIITVILAVAVPYLGIMISLAGGFIGCFIGFIFPAVVELLVHWEDRDFGKLNWLLWKDIFVIIFGLATFISCTYCNILELIEIQRKL